MCIFFSFTFSLIEILSLNPNQTLIAIPSFLQLSCLCSISPGATLFAYKNFIKKWDKIWKITPEAHRNQSWVIQLIKMEKFICPNWVKKDTDGMAQTLIWPFCSTLFIYAYIARNTRKCWYLKIWETLLVLVCFNCKCFLHSASFYFNVLFLFQFSTPAVYIFLYCCCLNFVLV